jgi:hypothetical protein
MKPGVVDIALTLVLYQSLKYLIVPFYSRAASDISNVPINHF